VVLTGPVLPPWQQRIFLESGILRLESEAEGSEDYSLPGSQAIVETMGGELRVDSDESGGTTYSVRLPAAPGLPAP
jgi:signal transduction histidine kinase